MNGLNFSWSTLRIPALAALLVLATAQVSLAQPLSYPTEEQSAANVQMDPVDSARFDFTNASQYSYCVEDILQLYKGTTAYAKERYHSPCLPEVFAMYGKKGLTMSKALVLIQAANAYTTDTLATALYPLEGQRLRIAEQLGHVYAIDVQNTTIQEAAAKARSTFPQ